MQCEIISWHITSVEANLSGLNMLSIFPWINMLKTPIYNLKSHDVILLETYGLKIRCKTLTFLILDIDISTIVNTIYTFKLHFPAVPLSSCLI